MTPGADDLQKLLPDRYLIRRELGSGGMATVFLADDTRLQRPVAIKVLRPELSSHVGHDRFLREIRFAARLNHPHVVPLFEAGEVGDVLYYVMPWVEGESLCQRLKRQGRMPVADAIQITRQVASALTYAHEHDIVHRDIKPGNILFYGGEAAVTDFGVARALTESADESFTTSGVVLGTPAYMPPEQAAGGRPVDGRADVYALGCVLYEMLTGEPPFSASTFTALLARHVHQAPLPMRTLNADVPVAIDRVVRRALAKSAADRFDSARDFARALSSAMPTPEPVKAWMPIGLVALLVGITLAIIAGAALLS